MFCCQFYLSLCLQRWVVMTTEELSLYCPAAEMGCGRWTVLFELFRWLLCDPFVSKQRSTLELYHQKPTREDTRCSPSSRAAKTRGLHCLTRQESNILCVSVCSLKLLTATLPRSYPAEFLMGKGST